MGMLPAALTPEIVYKEKQLAYEQLQTGSHWPNREEWFSARNAIPGVRPYFKKLPQLSLRQQQLYGLVRYARPSFEKNITSSPHQETPRDTSTMSDVEEKTSDDAKLPGEKQRRWGRSRASVGVSTAQGEVDGVTARRPPLAQNIPSSTEDPAPSCDSDDQSARNVRRLQKILKEIPVLEGRQSSGEKLLRNQIQKIERKEQYRSELRHLAPTLARE